MVKNIKIGEEIFPADLNMEVYLQFEEQTGRALSEFKGTTADALLLVYLAIEDGCDQKGIEFKKTLKEFRRGLGMADLNSITEFVTNAMNPEPEANLNGSTKKKLKAV